MISPLGGSSASKSTEVARSRIKEECLALLIGSPPRTMFSILQSMNPIPMRESEKEKEEYRERMKEAV